MRLQDLSGCSWQNFQNGVYYAHLDTSGKEIRGGIAGSKLRREESKAGGRFRRSLLDLEEPGAVPSKYVC